MCVIYIMSIHGLLQEPASYPSNFITLPFTIPTLPTFGSETFKSSKRSVTSTGGVPTMLAGQGLQDTIFDFSPINIYLSRVVVTLHLDDAYDYLGVDPFGMVCWEYGATVNQIKVTTYNSGVQNITDWSVELIAFPLPDFTALLGYYNDTNQNTRQSEVSGPPASPQPTIKWTFAPPVGSSFNENIILIGDTGILYVAEDAGKLLAVVDNGSSASLLWSVDTGFVNLNPPTLGNRNLLYGVGTDIINCIAEINTASPFVVWTTNLTPLTAPSPPLLHYDINGIPTIYVSGTGIIYSLNENGVVNWVFTTYNDITYLAITSDGSTIYATSNAILYALTSAGVLRWSIAVGTGSGFPTIGENGTIYLTSATTYIYAVTDNGTSGTIKWILNTLSLVALRKVLGLGLNGIIYVSNNASTGTNSRVFAVTDNGASGSINWSVNTLPTDPRKLSPPTIGLDGLIYVTADKGYFACITDNGASYTINYGFEGAPTSVNSSPCSIGINNRIYYGLSTNFIIAI